MKNAPNLMALLCAAAVVMAGCGNLNPWDPGNPGSGGNAALGTTIPEVYGVEWRLVAFEEWSGGKVAASTPVPDFLVYTATFTESALTGGDACNYYKAQYSLGSNNALSVFNLYEPESACGPASPDGAFIAALPQAEYYTATPSTLRIFYKRGTRALYFNRVISSIQIVPYEVINFNPGDPLQMKEAAITGDVLTLDVTYGGGCEKHTFELYGPETIPPGDPTQITAILIHDAHNDLCKALVSERLPFDLTPLKRRWQQATGRNSGEIELTISSFAPGVADRTIRYKF